MTAWPPHWLDDPQRWPVFLASALAHARDAYPHEACGYLVETDPLTAHPLPNASPTPARAFAVTSVPALAALDGAAASGARIVLYHSHPDGEARWSAADADAWDQRLWPVDHLVLAVGRGAPASAVLVRWCAARARFLETVRAVIAPAEAVA